MTDITQSGWERNDFAEHIGVNQAAVRTGLKPAYDFIVCGAGSSGSVVARRLAEEDAAANVLLIEAGGSDDVPAVMDATQQ
jgi:choline dehydrogenase